MAEQSQIYQLLAPADLPQLTTQMNLILSQLSDRLDAIEGNRGTPTFYSDVDAQGNKVQNVADPTNPSDAVNLKHLDNAITTAATKGQILITGTNFAEDSLQADVLMPIAGTFYDIPPLTLGAGVWLVSGQVTLMVTSANARFSAVLWDGITPWASSEETGSDSTTQHVTITLSPVAVFLNDSTTVKISVVCDHSNATLKATLPYKPNGNTASYITAYKIG